MDIEWLILSNSCVLLVTLLQCLLASGTELHTYEIEKNCRLAETRDEPAGILRLDTDTIFDSYDYRRSCAVKVTPKQVAGGTYRSGRVLFYFTEFDLPGTCSEFNISVVEGSSAYESPVLGRNGQGNVRCQRYAHPSRNGVQYVRASLHRHLTLGQIYAVHTWPICAQVSSYYNGPCPKGYDDEAVTCLNNRCVTSSYHCHAEIDTCGSGEESACEPTLEEAMSFVDSILETVKSIGIIVAVCIGGFLALKVLKGFGCNPVEKFRKVLGNGQQETQNETRIRSRAASFQTAVLNQQMDTQAADAISNQDSSSSDESNEGVESRDIQLNEQDLPPSYDKLSPVPTAPPHPDAAPPTYYDVMSDEELYRYKQ